jgi:hypothetical protein
MKLMKKNIFVLFLPLLLVSGLLIANPDNKNEKKVSSKSLTTDVRKANLEAKKKWESTPEGKKFKGWEASPEGEKVQASATKIMKSIKDFTDMEAVVTSLSLPPGSRLGVGVMVNIDGDDYILAINIGRPERNDYNYTRGYQQLHSLKVNDKIIIRSHNVSKAPKYNYAIIAGDYVERDKKVLFKRNPGKEDGC